MRVKLINKKAAFGKQSNGVIFLFCLSMTTFIIVESLIMIMMVQDVLESSVNSISTEQRTKHTASCAYDFLPMLLKICWGV